MSPGRGEGEDRGTLRTRQEKEKLNYGDTREQLPREVLVTKSSTGWNTACILILTIVQFIFRATPCGLHL